MKPSTTFHRHWFWVQTGETVTTNFESKSEKTVLAVLMPNHRQTVDIGFEAQSRNLRFSSPCARCRSHTASPDLLIVWSPNTRHVRSFRVLCTRFSTPATILVAACHATPITCTPKDKQMQFSKRNKDKGKTIKISRIQIQTSPSQWLITIKPRIWPLGFSIWISIGTLQIGHPRVLESSQDNAQGMPSCTATTLAALDSASLSRRALTLPCVSWLQTSLPCCNTPIVKMTVLTRITSNDSRWNENSQVHAYKT
jgi:hypothetical protein